MNACLSSEGSKIPLPSSSKIWKAALISRTYSRGRIAVTKSSALKGCCWAGVFADLGGCVGFDFFIRYYIKVGI